MRIEYENRFNSEMSKRMSILNSEQSQQYFEGMMSRLPNFHAEIDLLNNMQQKNLKFMTPNTITTRQEGDDSDQDESDVKNDHTM